MKVVNRTRQALLGKQVAVARTPRERAKGLLGTKSLSRGEGIWIIPCRSIHSFGMRFEFDALFVDREGKVLGLYPRFRRFRISRIYWKAEGVLELPAGTIDRTSTCVGDTIDFLKTGPVVP